MTHAPTTLNLNSVVRQLRAEGFAVAIISPTDLKNADPSRVEGHMLERGLDVIMALTKDDFYAHPI